MDLPDAPFNGPVYVPEFDHDRLKGQIRRIYSYMCRNVGWHQFATLDEISKATDAPPASVSAQLRHLKKAKFGSHTLHKRPRGDRKSGLWEYAIHPSTCTCYLCST